MLMLHVDEEPDIKQRTSNPSPLYLSHEDITCLPRGQELGGDLSTLSGAYVRYCYRNRYTTFVLP